jgi:hypothetical protein
MPQPIFVFVQMEFPWALGPIDGRYLLRSAGNPEPESVVVFETLAAGRDRSVRGSIAQRLSGATVEPEPDPTPVPTSRVTIVDPVPLSAEVQARSWLEDLDSSKDLHGHLETLNRVLHLHRLASADPYSHEVSPAQALVIRAGWGEGEQVASGRWLHAREIRWKGGGRTAPARRPGRRARSAALRPQERLAALLGARTASLLCEELTLRARLDLEEGRPRHAAIELDRALQAAIAELRAEGRQDLAVRIAELEQLAGPVAAQAAAFLSSAAGFELDLDAIAHALSRLEAALRARTATGFSLG